MAGKDTYRSITATRFSRSSFPCDRFSKSEQMKDELLKLATTVRLKKR